MAKTSVVNFLNHGVLKFSDNILIPRNGKEMRGSIIFKVTLLTYGLALTRVFENYTL